MQIRLLGRMGPAALAVAMAFGPAGPVAAQTDLTLTTPFPAVSIQPGTDASFEVTVTASEAARVELAVEGLPEGWSASITGGGNEVHAVYVTPDSPATVTLSIDVPADAALQETTVAMVATAGSDRARLEVNLIPADDTTGTVALEPDYPGLRGSAEDEFQFNLTLRNDTPQELVFTLQATAPAGWEASVQPAGQAAAASVTVQPRGTQRIEASVTPAFQTQAGAYPILVEAVAGEYRAEVELGVEVTGVVAMLLTTPDERLNTTATAGTAQSFAVQIINQGTSPLAGVQLSGQGPSEWEVTFDPAVIEVVEPGGVATATAFITPSGNAVAGDYAISLTASTEGANETLDVRVTVETPPIWGIVGAALIIGTLAAMAWVFRRYGRR